MNLLEEFAHTSYFWTYPTYTWKGRRHGRKVTAVSQPMQLQTLTT